MENEKTQYQLVTIEEMRELAKNEPYKVPEDEPFPIEPYPLELLKDKNTNLYYTDYFAQRMSDFIINHIMAEECIEHKDELDWSRVTNGYDGAILARIIGLYENPLVWSETPNNYILSGKYAKEECVERPEHKDLIDLLLNEGREKRAVWFAEHLPKKKMAKWDILMSNYHRADLLLYTCDSDYYADACYNSPVIGLPYLKENLEYIKEYCGVAKVEEVIARLREVWTHITKLKLCRFDELSEEEIQNLHEYVFDEVNYQIDVWKMEEDEEQETPAKECRYINREKIMEIRAWSVEEYTAQLREACQHADKLGPFLSRGKQIGYFDFMGDRKIDVYKHLKECFPGVITYGYPNFTLYFKVST